MQQAALASYSFPNLAEKELGHFCRSTRRLLWNLLRNCLHHPSDLMLFFESNNTYENTTIWQRFSKCWSFPRHPVIFPSPGGSFLQTQESGSCNSGPSCCPRGCLALNLVSPGPLDSSEMEPFPPLHTQQRSGQPSQLLTAIVCSGGCVS